LFVKYVNVLGDGKAAKAKREVELVSARLKTQV
jgi:hypothetical protein